MKILQLIFVTLLLIGSALSQSLPQRWVDNNEAKDGAFTLPAYELTFPNTWITGPPIGCTFHLAYAATLAGLQSAVNDMEACRTTIGAGIILNIPPALYTTSNSLGLVIPQSNTVQATSFLILRSTMDINLPDGITVCSHGIQDNLAASTDIGIDNPACSGVGMYYQLGTTITSISPGAFALASGVVTNTSAYNDAQYMWTLESSGGNPGALSFCSPVGASSVSNPPKCAAATIAPDHWLIEDAEARMSVGNTGNNNVVNMPITTTETSRAQIATHIHLRKMWVHGDWTTLAAGANSISNGFEIDCTYCSVVDSQVSQALRPGSEGHGILAQGEGPYKIDHNWVEGQSSGIFSGGYQQLTAFPIAGYMPFQDVEMRRNRLTFPYAWLGLMTVPGGNAHWAGQSIARKNALETKNGARLLEDGNIIENSDNSGGQSGVLADWNVRQFRTNYQNIIADATISNNIFRNGCEGIEFNNSAPSQGSGGGIAFNMHRVSFSNNLLYNLTTANPGCVGVSPSQSLETGNTGWIFQGTVMENPAGTAATFVPTCSASGGTLGTNGGDCPGQVSGFTITAGGTGCVAGSLTISSPAAGGIQAAGTYGCTAGALSNVTITNEGLQYTSAPTATIATGTGTLTTTIFTVPGGLIAGSEVMDFLAGDPIPVYNCPNVAGFNLPLTNYTTGSFFWPNILGPKATAVSNTVGSPSVTFPMVATPSVSDSSGYCTVVTTQGGPVNFSVTHNTVVGDNTILPSSNNLATQGPNFAMNFALQNNLLVSATGGTGWNSNRGEGIPTETFNYDSSSMTADHNVWPRRNSASYRAYGNNPNFPVASPVMYFPTTPYCTGASPVPSCVGFLGAMSAIVMPLTLPDYHSFSLLAGSSFKAGAANQASDGLDEGAILSSLDAAQINNLFSCTTACGSGPFPDVPVTPAGASGITLTGGTLTGGILQP